MWLSFFTGALSVTILFTIMLILLPVGQTRSIFDWEEMFASFYTFRFLFMLILTIFFTGLDIKILRHFKINYLFIFELDPHYKITHIQLFRVALMLLTVWLLSFMG